MQVKFYVSIGIGEGQEEIVELPDDYTNDDIEEEFLEWRAGYVDGYLIKLGDGLNNSDLILIVRRKL